MSEELDRARERRLRRRILSALHTARGSSPKGGLSGEAVRDHLTGLASVTGEVPDDDAHVMQLLRSLSGKGLAVESFLPRKNSIRFGLANVFYRIADKGERLLNETEPPDPDVADDRIIED